MKIEAIAALFREAMPYCWPNSHSLSRDQHRDLVRIFLMGYGEAILAECPDGEQRFVDFMEACAVISSPNWTPDAIWHWGSNDAD